MAIRAWEQGETALAAGDLTSARFALERANRLGPDDTKVRFLLGITMLRQGDPGCIGIFRKLIVRSDTQPAHRGLLSALMLGGRLEDQVAAAGDLLSRFAAPRDPEFGRVAADVASRSGLAGWCAAASDGRVTVLCAQPVAFQLDEEPIRPKADADGRYRLPSRWSAARRLSVTAQGRHLLGSPIDLTRHRFVEGFVTAEEGALRGWAWNPANPDTPVSLVVERAGSGKPVLTLETGEPAHFLDQDGLSTPRAFHLPAEHLSADPGLLHIRASSGQDITGSPIDPGQWTRAASQAAALIGRSLGSIRSHAAKHRSMPFTGVPVLPLWAGTPPPRAR